MNPKQRPLLPTKGRAANLSLGALVTKGSLAQFPSRFKIGSICLEDFRG
jgi:hypothetical protein